MGEGHGSGVQTTVDVKMPKLQLGCRPVSEYPSVHVCVHVAPCASVPVMGQSPMAPIEGATTPSQPAAVHSSAETRISAEHECTDCPTSYPKLQDRKHDMPTTKSPVASHSTFSPKVLAGKSWAHASAMQTGVADSSPFVHVVAGVLAANE